MAKPLRRRRATIAMGISGDRGSLVADLKAEKAQAESDARTAAYDAKVKANEEKAAKAESWAKEVNRIKSLAEQYMDESISLKEFKAEIDKSKGKFADNTDDLDNLFRQSVRNRDTINYNNYINGGVQFEDFKAYVESRKKDGGDVSNLNNLFSQAKLNEDKNQYSLYMNGVISYDQLKGYKDSRTKDGGDLTKLNGYLGLAKTNENKINDQLQAAQYNAGAINGTEYKSYLEGRIKDSTNPQEATAIRTALKSVEVNEVMKAADDVRAQYESGQITGGEAVQRLLSVKSSTTDSSTQNKLLGLMGQIQNADKAKGGSASTTINQTVANLKSVENDARSDYDKAEAAISSRLSKAGPGDYSRISDEMYVNHKTYRNVVGLVANNIPDQAWKKAMEGKGIALDATFSQKLYLAATQIANRQIAAASDEKTGVNIDKFGDAAEFLVTIASKNPHMTADDRQSMIRQGIKTLQDGYSEWSKSVQGIQWRDFVDNRTNEALSNNKLGLTELGKIIGVDISTITDSQARAFIEKVLTDRPDAVREALAKAGTPTFASRGLRDETTGLGKYDEGQSSDQFSKTVATLTATRRALDSANTNLNTKYNVGTGAGGLGVSPIDQAYSLIFNPSGVTPPSETLDSDEILAAKIRNQPAPREYPRIHREAQTPDDPIPTGSSNTPTTPQYPLSIRGRFGPAGPTPTPTPPVVNLRADREGPFNTPPVEPPVNLRVDREGPYNTNVPDAPDISLPTVDTQSSGTGSYFGPGGEDRYEYLNQMLARREAEWNVTSPTSDITNTDFNQDPNADTEPFSQSKQLVF